MDVVPRLHGEAHGLRRVRGHEDVAAEDGQFDVEDEFLLLIGKRRAVGLRRHFPEAGDVSEFAAKHGFVEGERFLGGAGEIEIGADAGHDVLCGAVLRGLKAEMQVHGRN